MLKPRPLPPAHKNQMFVPVKSFGFFNDQPTPTFFRNHEISKKKIKPKPSAVFAPSPYSTLDKEQDESSDKDLTSPRDSITSLIHVRGRGSELDVSDVRVKVEATPRKTPMSGSDGVKVTPFLTEDPTSSRSYDGRSSIFSPVLECSKYNVIGEPRFRKKRSRRSDWTLPPLVDSRRQGFAEPHNARHPKTNSIDIRSIYGSKSKIQQVPMEVKREDSVILPPLEIGRRRQDWAISVDAGSLAEKRLVMDSQQRQHNLYRRLAKDSVTFPTAYRTYFRLRKRRQQFVQCLLSPDAVWENNPQPVHCSRCLHQSTATVHYCDVLGKRFCRFCSEMTERAFSQAYEGNRLLVPSPHKSPTLKMVKEPSFIGVRKIVITKTAKVSEKAGEGQGQGQGHEPDPHNNSEGAKKAMKDEVTRS